MLTFVDIIFIFMYFLVIGLVGYFSSKNETSEDFFIAERNLNTFNSVCSITSTKINAEHLLTIVSAVYLFGISTIWIVIGVIFGYTLFLQFAIGLKKEGDLNNYYTMGDYFKHRYGTITSKIVSIIIVTYLFCNVSIQFIAGSKIIESLTSLPFCMGVLLCSVVISFYLFLGGFKVVIKTDIVQFVSMFLLLFVLGVFLYSNFEFVPSQWEIFAVGPKLIIVFFLIGFILPFATPALWQRIFAVKDVKTVKKSLILVTIVYTFFCMLLIFLAFIIKIKLPGIDPDTALIAGFQNLLPTGFLGIGIVTLFAAIMSSADSYIFVASEMLLYNILGLKRSVRSLKIGIIFISTLTTISALFFMSLLNVMYILLGLACVVSSAVIASWIWKYISSIVVISGMLIGVIGIFLFIILAGMENMRILPIIGLFGGISGMIIGKCILLVIKVHEYFRIKYISY